MTQCGLKRGFFTLRTCDKIAVYTCLDCGRPFCVEHSGLGLVRDDDTAASPKILCIECATNAADGTLRRDLYRDDDDPLFDLRRWFLLDRHFTPHDLSKKFSPDAEKVFAAKAGEKGIVSDKGWDKQESGAKGDEAKSGFADS